MATDQDQPLEVQVEVVPEFNQTQLIALHKLSKDLKHQKLITIYQMLK